MKAKTKEILKSTLGTILLFGVPATALATSIWGYVHCDNKIDEVCDAYKSTEIFAVFQNKMQQELAQDKEDLDKLKIEYDAKNITSQAYHKAEREYESKIKYSTSIKFAVDCLLKSKDTTYYKQYCDWDKKKMGAIFGMMGSLTSEGALLTAVCQLPVKENQENTQETENTEEKTQTK